jgi:hypothetical protein
MNASAALRAKPEQARLAQKSSGLINREARQDHYGACVIRAIVVMAAIVVRPVRIVIRPVRIHVCAALMQGTDTPRKAPLGVGAGTNIAVAATEIALVMNGTCRCCRRHQ